VIVTNGTFLGVGPLGSPFAAAEPVLQQATQLLADGTALPTHVVGCRVDQSGASGVWMTLRGGLYLLWEGVTTETARLTNWGYVDPAIVAATISPGPALITDTGITVGSPRAAVLAAYSSAAGTGDVIDVPGLRFELAGDVVRWFGQTSCNPTTT
jgi:hypothetical protein